MSTRSRYLVTVRRSNYGTFKSLRRAVNEGRLVASHAWDDAAIWLGTQLVAIVLAGGRVQVVKPDTFDIVSDLEDAEPVLDIEALGDGYTADADSPEPVADPDPAEPMFDLDALEAAAEWWEE